MALGRLLRKNFGGGHKKSYRRGLLSDGGTNDWPWYKNLLLLLGIPIVIFLNAIVVGILSFAIVAPLPLLWFGVVVSRLVQFCTRGKGYDQAVKVKYIIRFLIFIAVLVALVLCGSFLQVIDKWVVKLSEVMVMRLPLTDWISIARTVCYLEIFSFLLSVFLFFFMPQISLTQGNIDSSVSNFWDATVETASSLVLWWIVSEVARRVPAFQEHKMLGLATQKWIEIPIFLLIGHNIITLLTFSTVWSLWKLASESVEVPTFEMGSASSVTEAILELLTYPGRWVAHMLRKLVQRNVYLVYFAIGTKRNIILLLTWLMILLTWVLYIGPNLDRTSSKAARRVFDIGTWTCLCLFIFSFLRLIKNLMLLSWEANVIYFRLNSKISEIGKQLYFLAVLGGPDKDILQMRRQPDMMELYGIGFYALMAKIGYLDSDDEIDRVFDGTRREKVIRDELLQTRVKPESHTDIVATQQMCQRFLEAKDQLLSETYTSDLLNTFTTTPPTHHDLYEKVKDRLSADDWDYFVKEYCKNSKYFDQPDIRSEKYRRWMERAHDKCLFLSNTISSAKEAAICLNQITSALLIVAIFILWLLLTGLATTKMFAVITAPLLAATFIFGETCRNLFQGIIFVFVVHPFDIGDLCIIDGEMMVVKAISVWRTTFSKIEMVGTGVEVIYPNTELSRKVVINHKIQFDCKDYLEFNVSSLDKIQVHSLKHKIESYLNQGEKFDRSSHNVTISVIEEKTKIAVRFKYKMNVEKKTYGQCLKRKDKLKSIFSVQVRDLVDDEITKQCIKTHENTYTSTETTQEIKRTNLDDSEYLDSSFQVAGISEIISELQ